MSKDPLSTKTSFMHIAFQIELCFKFKKKIKQNQLQISFRTRHISHRNILKSNVSFEHWKPLSELGHMNILDKIKMN